MYDTNKFVGTEREFLTKVEKCPHPFLLPLNSTEEEHISNILESGGSISEFGLNVTADDLECLLPGSWLNDEVINFL
eukprot:UN29718